MSEPMTGWTAPLPRCPEHGRMSYRPAPDRWVCPGWDGEGCPYTVRHDDLDWHPLQLDGGITFSPGAADG
jgi:hypothetical protein